MAKSRQLAPESELHFKHIAARAMRQVLVEAARRRKAYKRGGGGSALMVTFDDSMQVPVSTEAKLVDIRFFGGLGASETALLDVAVDVPASEQHDFLRAACDGDEALMNGCC